MRTAKPAPPSSIQPRTEPSVKIWNSAGGTEARVRCERSVSWDGDVLLSTGVMTVGMGWLVPWGNGKLLTGVCRWS